MIINQSFSVDISDDKISIFDTGPGMDGSDENGIVKWYAPAPFGYFQDTTS